MKKGASIFMPHAADAVALAAARIFIDRGHGIRYIIMERQAVGPFSLQIT